MQLKLKEKKVIIPDRIITFVWESPEPVEWKAGQYMIYTLPHKNMDDRKDERYFTVSAAPYEKNLAFTSVFAEEKGSSFKKALREMEPGDTIEAKGPMGRFTVDDPSLEYVFIAGGIGVTPFRSIFLELDNNGGPINVKLLWGNRDENFPLNDVIKPIADKHDSFTIEYFVDPDRIGEDDIRKAAPDLKKPIFMISGPEPMVQAFVKLLADMGVPADHIKRDDFPGYDWP